MPRPLHINFNFFILLLTLVTIGFFTILRPFFDAIFWAVIFAVIFYPLHSFILQRLPHHPNIAALVTLMFCILLGILPLALISLALVQEIVVLYQRIDSGQLNFSEYFNQFITNLPPWVNSILDFFNVSELSEMHVKLQQSIAQGSRLVANQAVAFGQNTFMFFVSLGIMLYLLFFLFRDGIYLSESIKNALPLNKDYHNHIFEKFTTVVKATVKGNVLVSIMQGILGGIIFWILGIQGALLWAVIMAFLSLLPAIGSALIWFPVGVYFLTTGQIWSGVILLVFGFGVIGLTDNLLRPILVGKSTRLPDYLVLISTIGGLAVFGPNGFVIGPLLAALFIVCWQLFTEIHFENEVLRIRQEKRHQELLEADTRRKR